jgi:hypothetical protein
MIDFKDLKGVDATSEYSMDSAYQSQSGSTRRGGAYQSSPIQEQTGHTFMAQGLSPSLASESFVPFSESHNINGLTTTENLDFGNGTQWFANSSSAQDYTTYSPRHNASCLVHASRLQQGRHTSLRNVLSVMLLHILLQVGLQ